MDDHHENRLIQLADALAQESLRPVTDLTKATMAGIAREVLRMTAPPASVSAMPR